MNTMDKGCQPYKLEPLDTKIVEKIDKKLFQQGGSQKHMMGRETLLAVWNSL